MRRAEGVQKFSSVTSDRSDKKRYQPSSVIAIVPIIASSFASLARYKAWASPPPAGYHVTFLSNSASLTASASRTDERSLRWAVESESSAVGRQHQLGEIRRFVLFVLPSQHVAALVGDV